MMDRNYWGIRNRNGYHLSEKYSAGNRNEKGFTLVELIVVLVILAILAGIAVPVALGFIDRANDKKVISVAEASMTATQTVLNDEYNGGTHCISLDSRTKARDLAKASADNVEESDFNNKTEFKIWTVKTWEENSIVKATAKYAGYYTIQYAFFKNSDGKVAFYNGKEWNVYDSETKITDSTYVPEKSITIWPINPVPSDYAVNPQSHIDENEAIAWDDDSPSGSLKVILQLKANSNADDKLLFAENGSPENRTWSKDKTYNGEDFSEWIEKWTDPQNILIVNRCYTNEDLVWTYINPNPVEVEEDTQFVSADEIEGIVSELAATDESSIIFTAQPKGKKVPVTVSVSPVNANNLTVNKTSVKGLLDLSDMTYETNNKEDSGYSNSFVADVQSISVSKKDINNNKVNWDGSYRFVDENYPNSAYNCADLPVRVFGGENVTGLISARISAYTGPEPEIDNLDSIKLDFAVAANTTKEVVLKAKQEYSDRVFFGGKEKKNSSFTYAFNQNEAVGDITFGDKYTFQTSVDDSGEEPITSIIGIDEAQDALLKEAGMVYPENSKFRPRGWTMIAYDANNAVLNPGESGVSPEWDSFNNPMKKALEELFIGNNGQSFREVAEVDLAAQNSRLDATAKETNERSPIWDDFYWLVSGQNPSATATNDLNLASIMSQVQSIEFFSSLDDYNKLTKIREICLSQDTTDVERDGNLLKREQSNGKLVNKPRNTEYPCYIVACLVNGDNGYRICVASEDGSEMKAINSLQSMFADCTNLITNSMIDNMDISTVTSTRDMFKDNRSYNNANVSNLSTCCAKDMSFMFKNCYALNQNMIAHIDNAQTIQYMYAGCNLLSNVKLCGTNANTECPLGNNTLVQHVFADTILYSLTIENVVFTEITENDTKHNERDNKIIKTDLTNGLYQLTHSAIYEAVNSVTGKRTLTRVEFKNVTCPKLETTRSLFSQSIEADDLVDPSITSLKYVDLSTFSVPNNTSTRKMFYCCKELTGTRDGDNYLDLGNGNLMNQKGDLMNMSTMFGRCNKFEITAVDGVDTSKAKYLDYMFEKTAVTEADLSIQNATSICSMFLDCKQLNHARLYGTGGNCPLKNTKDYNATNLFGNCEELQKIEIENLKFTALTSYGEFFKVAQVKDFYTGNNVSVEDVRKMNLKEVTFNKLTANNVTSMASLFADAVKLDTVKFNELSGTKMSSMQNLFLNDKKLKTVDITNLSFTSDTGVMTVYGMFNGCEELEGRRETTTTGLFIDNTLITSQVNNMSFMFNNCKKLDVNQELLNNLTPKYNTGVNCSSMFAGCISIKGDEKEDGHHELEFDITKVNNISSMFRYCSALDTVVLKGKGFDEASVWDTCDNVVFGSSSIKHLVIKDVYLEKIICDKDPYGGQDSDVDTVFKTLISSSKNTLEKIELINVQFSSQYPIMTKLFSGFPNLKAVEFKNVKAPNLGRLKCMFENSKQLETVTFSKFDAPEAWNFSFMFNGCTGLKTVDFGKVGEDKEIHTHTENKATEFDSTFMNCTSLTTINGLESFDTSNAINMKKMFNNCRALTELDLSSFDTSAVTNVNNFVDMFGTSGNSSLTTIYASRSFVVNSTTTVTMFGTGLTLLDGGNGTVYNPAHKNSDYAHLDGGEANPGYFRSKELKYSSMRAITTNAWQLDGKKFSDVRGTKYFGRKDISDAPSNARNVAKPNEIEIWVWEELNEDGSYSIYWCSEADVIKIDSTSKGMFMYWGSKKSMVSSFKADFQGLDFSDVSSFEKMIGGVYNGESSQITQVVDLSKGDNVDYIFDISSATSVNNLFEGCSQLQSASFKGNIAGNVSMKKMFLNCSSLTSVDFSGVSIAGNISGTGTDSTFSGCGNLTTIYVAEKENGGIDKEKITGTNTNMFTGCNSLVGQNGTRFSEDKHLNKDYARVDLPPDAKGYFSLKEN